MPRGGRLPLKSLEYTQFYSEKVIFAGPLFKCLYVFPSMGFIKATQHQCSAPAIKPMQFAYVWWLREREQQQQKSNNEIENAIEHRNWRFILSTLEHKQLKHNY